MFKTIFKKIFLVIMFLPLYVLAEDFSLTSTNVSEGGTLSMDQVFNSFGCTGKNMSPQLSWKGEPIGTKSFAINVYDPDAPTGSGWWHWTIFNIPLTVHELSQNSSANSKQLPKGAVQGRTDYGVSQFGGACPPVGDKPHRYIFTVYALDTEKLDLNKDSSGALIGYYLNKHALAKSSITATYGR